MAEAVDYVRRYEIVNRLMDGWPRTPTGKLSKGFWRCALQEVEAVEGSIGTYRRARNNPGCAYHHDFLGAWWSNYHRRTEEA